MAILQSTLTAKSKSYNFVVNKSQNRSNFPKSAFLCHSHNDGELAKGLVAYFNEIGVNLYVDWMDNTMPEAPNGETAIKIQNAILKSDYFLFLATANSKTSRWCPWEIGYADSSKKKIYIVPTEDHKSTYGNEYLQLYPKIDVGNEGIKTGLAVFQPNQNKGTWLQMTL